MMELIKDLLGFLIERKKLWMAPIISGAVVVWILDRID